jgi:GAF domain-containing protein
MIAALPHNESARLEALYAYQILDSEPEHPFDLLAAQVAAALGTPIAVIGFIDETRHWFKAKFGTPVNVNKRDWATCAHTILEAKPIGAPDVRLDARFADMPPLEQLGVKAYAGAPIINADGCAVGTVCVFDNQVHLFSQTDLNLLEGFARQVLGLLEVRMRQEESMGVEIASQLLPNSEPSAGLEQQILKALPKKQPYPHARIERLSQDRMRVQFDTRIADGMKWQLWVMSPLDNKPLPVALEPNNEFFIERQVRVLMISQEPTNANLIYPTKIITVLPLEPERN